MNYRKLPRTIADAHILNIYINYISIADVETRPIGIDFKYDGLWISSW
jgi:hypothetical protein